MIREFAAFDAGRAETLKRIGLLRREPSFHYVRLLNLRDAVSF